MVLCWIALPVFAILSIFSVKYRKLTKESLECMFKTITLRKCQSGLDDRIRSDLTGKIMRKHPKAANLFYKNYKLISWVFLILIIISAYLTFIGIYNYFAYGNCNGEDSPAFCVLNTIIEKPDKIRELSEQYNLSYEKLASCFEENINLGEEECLTYCLENLKE